jgi:hypothetical protein
MYHTSDTHLFRELKSNIEIMDKYPIQDDTWSSRRWNIDLTDYMDLSGGYDVVCHNCHDIQCCAEYIEEKANHRGWENAEFIAIDKFSEDTVRLAIELLIKQKE